MNRLLTILLMLCFSLLGIATFKHAQASHSVHPVSKLTVVSGEKGAIYLTAPENKDSNPCFSFDIDNEEEDELLRKQSLLIKYAVAFIKVFLTHSCHATSSTEFSFFQHHADAAFPRHVRLHVFRI